MNSKTRVVLILALLIAIIATFIVFHLIYGNGGPHHHDFYRDIVQGIAFMFGIAGIEILKNSGYRKITKYFLVYSFIFFIALIVLGLFLHYTRLAIIIVEYVYYSWYAALAGMFPLSLYLKYKKKKSTSQSTVADAN
jgi:cation transport ATPase